MSISNLIFTIQSNLLSKGGEKIRVIWEEKQWELKVKFLKHSCKVFVLLFLVPLSFPKVYAGPCRLYRRNLCRQSRISSPRAREWCEKFRLKMKKYAPSPSFSTFCWTVVRTFFDIRFLSEINNHYVGIRTRKAPERPPGVPHPAIRKEIINYLVFIHFRSWDQSVCMRRACRKANIWSFSAERMTTIHSSSSIDLPKQLCIYKKWKYSRIPLCSDHPVQTSKGKTLSEERERNVTFQKFPVD